MLIEFAQGRPIVVDRALYRVLVKGAINRTHDDLVYALPRQRPDPDTLTTVDPGDK